MSQYLGFGNPCVLRITLTILQPEADVVIGICALREDIGAIGIINPHSKGIEVRVRVVVGRVKDMKRISRGSREYNKSKYERLKCRFYVISCN